ncbi:MAG: hypothetical protein P1V20_31280, partial [Verrucomicrobiales bacterium]|nr:hypothetical protein [Verrucomicrobiales bacterium]
LRREHTLARGDDGIATVYFVTVPNMPMAYSDDPDVMANLEAELRQDQEIAAWMDEITEDLNRRNVYLASSDPAAQDASHPRAAFDLRSWYDGGPELLEMIDAKERLTALKEQPASDEHQLISLDERLDCLAEVIAARLDRCLLAELAGGNLGRSYSHFVGRHRELIQLHHALTTDRRGLLTATHGMGGQGKTALAVQYAFAYAEFYASGGRWVISCEGKKNLGEALEELALDPALDLGTIPEEIIVNPMLTTRWVLQRLEAFTLQNHQVILNRLAANPALQSAAVPEVQPRMLLIFDNVDCPEILHPDQLALLPREEWLQIVATTRLNPDQFGTGADDMNPIPVDSLPRGDALALLREFQPQKQFSSDEEELAAGKIIQALGGYTLAVELVAAHLGEISPGVTRGISFTEFYHRLSQEGLVGEIDEIAEQTAVRHAAVAEFRFNQISFILDDTLATFEAEAISLLQHAAVLAPDFIVVDWLRDIFEDTDRSTPCSKEDVIKELAPYLQKFTDGNPALVEAIENIAGKQEEITPLITLLKEGLSDVSESSRERFSQLLDQWGASVQDTTPSTAGRESRFRKAWRAISGSRLLTGATLEDATMPEQTDPVIPHLARIHRVVAEHIRQTMTAAEQTAAVEDCISAIDQFQRYFEEASRVDVSTHWLLRPLDENVVYLDRIAPGSHRLALAAHVAGQAHLVIGQFGRAEKLIRLCASALQNHHSINPEDWEISRLFICRQNHSGRLLPW